jgi:hypothetical protein
MWLLTTDVLFLWLFQKVVYDVVLGMDVIGNKTWSFFTVSFACRDFAMAKLEDRELRVSLLSQVRPQLPGI